MKTASVGEIQKNFAKVICAIHAGEEIMIARRGKMIPKITAVGPQEKLQWPDFMEEAIKGKGKPSGEIVLSNRKERF